MTDEKWLELKETLKNQFNADDETEEIITKDDLGNEIINNVERLIFTSQMGKFRAERVTRPKILDKKTHYSHTAGTKGLIEYVLSPDEMTQKLTLFKFDDDTDKWEEVDLSSAFKF